MELGWDSSVTTYYTVFESKLFKLSFGVLVIDLLKGYTNNIYFVWVVTIE